MRAGREHAGGAERVDPHLPILAAHDRDGVGDLLLGRGLDGDVVDDALVGVDRLGGEGRADRLERGAVDVTPVFGCVRRGEARRVDDGIDLAEVGFDRVDDLLLDRVGEGVAIDALRVEAGGVRGVLEGDRIVPAGAAGAAFLAGLFKEDAERRRAAGKGRHDAAREPVAGGGADHEHALRQAGDRALCAARSRSAPARAPRSRRGGRWCR